MKTPSSKRAAVEKYRAKLKKEIADGTRKPDEIGICEICGDEFPRYRALQHTMKMGTCSYWSGKGCKKEWMNRKRSFASWPENQMPSGHGYTWRIKQCVRNSRDCKNYNWALANKFKCRDLKKDCYIKPPKRPGINIKAIDPSG